MASKFYNYIFELKKKKKLLDEQESKNLNISYNVDNTWLICLKSILPHFAINVLFVVERVSTIDRIKDIICVLKIKDVNKSLLYGLIVGASYLLKKTDSSEDLLQAWITLKKSSRINILLKSSMQNICMIFMKDWKLNDLNKWS